MNQHSKWSSHAFNVFEKVPQTTDSSNTASTFSLTPRFNITAKSFIPTTNKTDSNFDPFQPLDAKEEDEDVDDIINDLSQHLISSHLLDEEEEEEQDEPSITTSRCQVWDISKEWIPSSQQHIQDIWHTTTTTSEPLENRKKDTREEDEQEFDPTLQFYHGSLYDSNTIQDMNLLSLNVTNPSLEETEADNVGEDMSTLQMMQTIFSDLSDEELMETLARHDYDVDRAIESLLTKKVTIEPPPTVKKRQVCRHFLAGECYRKDCWFVHDLQEKVCKFWLQGTCLKGDSCEFSHVIDVQEVANKITPTTPTITSAAAMNVNDYPQLSSTTTTATSRLTTTPHTIIHATPVNNTEEEFPSLASASKIKKPQSTTNMVKGGTAINFAAAAKKKGTAVKSNNKSTNAKKAIGISKRHGHSMQRLKQPVHIPWLDTGSALNSIYMKEREQAIEYGMLRNRFFSKATEYYLKGDGAKAKLYSMEAKHYNRLMQEMHTEASKRIFEQRSKHEAFIDLHGLHEDEALDIVEQRLHHLKNTYDGIIYIVTGTGHHSGANGLSKKTSKLKPSVYNYLTQENYRFAETNMVGDNRGGVFAVDLR